MPPVAPAAPEPEPVANGQAHEEAACLWRREEDRPPPTPDGTLDRDAFLHRYAEQWRALDPEAFPFVHEIVDEFEAHDDNEQFRAALELTLAGLRLHAEA